MIHPFEAQSQLGYLHLFPRFHRHPNLEAGLVPARPRHPYQWRDVEIGQPQGSPLRIINSLSGNA